MVIGVGSNAPAAGPRQRGDRVRRNKLGLGSKTFGIGVAGLDEADQNQIAREEQQRSERGSPGFTNFDSILGLQRQLSGNNSLRNQDGSLRSLADVAGQQDISLSGGQREAFSQFFSPTVSGVQQQSLEALAKRAAAQGLGGGAVRGQLGDLATQFVAGNRARAFGAVTDAIGARLDDVESASSPFLQQVGIMRQGLARGATTDILRASGGTSGDFGRFARTGLRALSAIGLGADALAGIADRQGAQFDRAGLTGRGDVSQAFQQFLDPGTQGLGGFLSQQGLQVQRDSRGFFSSGKAVGGRNLARASQRVGAGEQLAGIVGQTLQQLGGEAAEFTASGTLGIQEFTRSGSIASARNLAGLDFSKFSGLQKALGIGQGVRTQQGQAGALSGTQFIAGNPLFKTVFG